MESVEFFMADVGASQVTPLAVIPITTYDYFDVQVLDGVIYTSTDSGIYRIKTDASGEEKLSGIGGYFAVSPGGKRMVYSNAEGTYLLYLDGSGERRLFDGNFQINAWLPDNENLLVTRLNNPFSADDELMIVNLENLELKNVTTGATAFFEVSPSGSKIVFSRSNRGQRLYVMNVDGSEMQRITNGPLADFAPIWSPDSSKIIYCSCSPSQSDIGLVNADGTGQRILLENVSEEFWLDDANVVFVRRNWGSAAGYTLTKINLDDSTETVLLNGGRIFKATLSPDKKMIAYQGDCTSDGKCDVFVVNIDGTDIVNLTHSPDYYAFLSWQP